MTRIDRARPLVFTMDHGDRKRRNLATGTIDDIGEIDTRLINQQARADDTEFGEYVVHHM